MACGVLVTRPGIELTPPALEARSLNHWTAREVPIYFILKLTVTIHGCFFREWIHRAPHANILEVDPLTRFIFLKIFIYLFIWLR